MSTEVQNLSESQHEAKLDVMRLLPTDDEIKKFLERPYTAYDDEGEVVYSIMQCDLNQLEGAKKIRDFIAERLQGNNA